MPGPSDQFREIVRLLRQHGVEFIVIGGQAEVLFGGARVTFDTDICYSRNTDNIARLVAVLRQLHSKLRNVPPDLPFRLEPQTISNGSNFTFDTDQGEFDMLAHVDPIGDFAAVKQNAETYDFDGAPILAIGLDDLIKVKQHIRRNKDRESLLQLAAIKRLREEGADRFADKQKTPPKDG